MRRERRESEVDLKEGGDFSKSGRRSEEEERSWGDHEICDRPAQRLGRKGRIAKGRLTVKTVSVILP